MPKKTKLPFIFFLLACFFLIIPFFGKFAPLFRQPPKPPKSPGVWKEAEAVIAESRSPTAAPTSEVVNAIPTGTPSPASVEEFRKPVMSSPAPAIPSREEVLEFIDNYIALGDSNEHPLARADVIAFPMENYMGNPCSRQDWIARRSNFNAGSSLRNYSRAGKGMFSETGNANRFSAIVPVAFSLKDKNGKITEGITFDRIGARWDGRVLEIVSHENLCTRITRENGRGIASNAWKTGTVAPSREGTTNIRYEDSDERDDTVLKAASQGANLQYLPQDARWLVVKDEEGSVGFMSAKYVR